MKKFVILAIATMFIVLFSGIIPLRGQSVWGGQHLALHFCLFLGVSLVLWQFNRFISLFTFVCLLSAFFVARCSITSMVFLIQFNLGCLACYGVSKFNKTHRRCILYGILSIILLQYVWLILQTFNLDFLFDSKFIAGGDELVGFSGSADQLGTFFAITLPVALYFFPPLVSLSVVGMILSKSSFAFVAGIMSGLLYLFFVNRKLFIILLIVSFSIALWFFLKMDRITLADFDTRLAVWKHSIRAVIDEKIQIIKGGRNLEIETRAWYGYGFGNYMHIFPYVPQEFAENKFNYANEKFNHAHNDYVELLFEFGYMGVALLIGFLGSLLLTFSRAVRTKEFMLCSSCILAYLLNSMGNFCSQIAVSGMLFILFLGMFYGIRREQVNDEKQRKARSLTALV